MKDKLEIGMYIRSNEGYIAKFIEKKQRPFYAGTTQPHFDYIFDGAVWDTRGCDGDYDECELTEREIELLVKEPSYNIMDLIEVGDYVNDYKVIHKGFDDNRNNQLFIDWNETEKSRGGNCITLEDIKIITTKERFEKESYKVGDENGR